MRKTEVVGLLMILVAVVLGAALASGLYEWESSARAAKASSLSTPTPQLASSTTASNVSQASNPEAAAKINAGANVFASECSGCHPNANAGVGPALHGATFAARYPDDAAIKTTIRQGRGGMPAFSPDKLSDADVDAVIAYLRSLK